MNTAHEIAEEENKPQHIKRRRAVRKTADWPKTGFVRLSQIIGPGGPLPISRSSWYAGINAGRYPKQVSLGAKSVGWPVEEINLLIEKMRAGQYPRVSSIGTGATKNYSSTTEE
jgi:prophage regulatory protein